MQPTVFIVGAGASTDFGLPLGGELAENIRARLETELSAPLEPRPIFDAAIEQTLAVPSEDSIDFGAAAKNLCGGLAGARSIDRLIDSRKGRLPLVNLGKCGIVTEISRAEAASHLRELDYDTWEGRQIAVRSTAKTWIAQLFSILHEGIAPEDAKSVFAGISFVTFNYDRCIEKYLRLAFQQVMSLSAAEATALVNAIPIVHVYGSLGDLPDEHGNGGVLFGPSKDFIKQSAGSIRTFTEGSEEGTLNRARELIENSTNIVILGFAFDPVNVAAIFNKPINNNPTHLHRQRLVGTGMGIAAKEREFFRATAVQIKDLDFDRIFPTMKCADFIASDLFKNLLN
jgi:hypothetical protein